MEIIAQLNYLRIAPRKMRLLVDMVRGKSLNEAKRALDFKIKRGSLPLKKLFLSCLANAKNNFNLDETTLVIKEIKVDEGPKLKRWRARSKGRAMQIQKKTSHITLVLTGQAAQKKARTSAFEEEKPKSSQQTAEGAKKQTERAAQEKPKGEKPKMKAEKGIRKALSKAGGQRVFRRKAF